MRTRQELTNDLFWGLHKETKALTRKEICKMLGYKSKSPSPHIIQVIEQLVSEGFLIKIDLKLPNNITQYKYFTNQLEAENLLNQKDSPTN